MSTRYSIYFPLLFLQQQVDKTSRRLCTYGSFFRGMFFCHFLTDHVFFRIKRQKKINGLEPLTINNAGKNGDDEPRCQPPFKRRKPGVRTAARNAPQLTISAMNSEERWCLTRMLFYRWNNSSLEQQWNIRTCCLVFR